MQDSINQLKAELDAKIQAREKELLRMELDKKIKAREHELMNASKEVEELEPSKSKEKPSFARKMYQGFKSKVRSDLRTVRSGLIGIAEYGDIPNLAAMGLHAAGLKETPTFYASPSEKVKSGIDWLTQGKLKPRTKGEEWEDAIKEGLIGGVAPAVVTGGASIPATIAKAVGKKLGKEATPRLVRKMAVSKSTPYALNATNIGSNIGATTGTKIFLDSYDENEKPGMLGALSAGALGAWTGGRLGRQPGVIKKLAKGDHSEAYKRHKELDIPMSVSDVTKGKLPYYTDLILSKSLGAGEHFDKHYAKRNEQLARHLGQTGEFPLEAKKAIPTHLAKEGAEGYKKRISDIMGKHRENVEGLEQEMIKRQAPIDATDTYHALKEKGEHLLVPEAIKAHEKEAHGLFEKKIRDYSDAYTGKETKDKFMPVGEHEQLRKQALEAKKANPSAENIDVYNVFREGRERFLERIMSPSDAHRFKRSSAVYAGYKEKPKGGKSVYDVRKKLENAVDNSEAFNKLASKDSRYTKVVMSGLPRSERRLLTESIIHQAGKDKEAFNINRAHSKLSNMTPEQLKESLRGFTANERSTFNKAMDIIGRNKSKYAHLANTSGTAHTAHNIQKIGHGVAAIGSAATGNIGPLALSALGFATTNLSARAWTNQKFVSAFDRLNHARTATQKTKALNLFMRSEPMREALHNEAMREKENNEEN